MNDPILFDGEPLEEPCHRCNGSGAVPKLGMEWTTLRCDHCDGEGLQPNERGMAILQFVAKYHRPTISLTPPRF